MLSVRRMPGYETQLRGCYLFLRIYRAIVSCSIEKILLFVDWRHIVELDLYILCVTCILSVPDRVGPWYDCCFESYVSFFFSFFLERYIIITSCVVTSDSLAEKRCVIVQLIRSRSPTGRADMYIMYQRM